MSRLVLVLLSVLLLFSSCSIGVPDGAEVVKDFDKEKYLGKWYEIARLDHRFERGLNQVTANYSLNDNGTIKVINKGFNVKVNKWEEADGIAKFVDKDDIGKLKVSFFEPFYGSYNIIGLTENYKQSLVIGKDTNYAWILSRTKTIPDSVRQNFLNQLKEIGFKTEELIWVEHSN